MASSEDFETLWSIPMGPKDRLHFAKRKRDGLEVTLRVVELAQCTKQQAVLNDPYFKAPYPGIAQILGTFEEGSSLYIVMENCPKGDLSELIERYSNGAPFELARQYAAELVDIYEALQAAGLVHQDIKPTSLLRTSDGHLKLMMNPYDKISTEVPDYASPELLNGDELTSATDIWGIACVIYELLAGRPAFTGDTNEITTANILIGALEFPESMPPFAQYLLEKMLRTDPVLRLKELDALKGDIFFHGLDFATIRSEHIPDGSPAQVSMRNSNPQIVMSGVVKKKAGWIYKKRLLVISDQPRISYYEPSREEYRGDIAMSPEVKAEVKGRVAFHIITPKRTYYFKDLTGNPEVWVSAVQEMLGRVYK